MSMLKVLLGAALLVVVSSGANAVDSRPEEWARPISSGRLKNLYRISTDLYRSEQPEVIDIPELKTLGIRSVLSLRDYHSDSKEFERREVVMLHCPMSAGSLTAKDIVAALKLLKTAPKPALVHCWHGSDRTGAVVAAYRMVCQNWTADKAIAELREGGYGFHEIYLSHMTKVLQGLDVSTVRKELGWDALAIQ